MQQEEILKSASLKQSIDTIALLSYSPCYVSNRLQPVEKLEKSVSLPVSQPSHSQSFAEFRLFYQRTPRQK